MTSHAAEMDARYQQEYDRLLGVMNARLEGHEFLAGDYSIADIASFPWVVSYKRLGATMDAFPHLRRWFDTIKVRPAVRRGIDLGKDWKAGSAGPDDKARAMLFGQTAESIENAKREAE